MEKIKQDVVQILTPLVPQLTKEQLFGLLDKTKNRSHGLLTFRVFSLKSEANNIYQKLKESKPDFIKKVDFLSGFINFHFHDWYIQEALQEQLTCSQEGLSEIGRGKTWVIDYSSPNIAKYMNVGHLRATVIGQAIVNMARAHGYKVIALNHLGDWGTQFGKLIVAYQKWGDSKSVNLDHLVQLYVRFHEEADESLNQQAQDVFKRMENGDEGLLSLWKSFVDISMENYQKIWKQLDVHHDIVQGESFYKDQTLYVEKYLEDEKLLQKSEGAQVVFLKDNQPPFMVRKKDGASTYACRDLASIFYRFEKLKVDKNIYVAGVDHHLHFDQLKGVLQKFNPQWDENTIHLSFGMYRFKGQGKLSTRKGQVVSLSDLIEQACSRVESIISEKNPQLKNKEQVAESVGIGALIFNDLKNDRIKDVDFSWEHILNFDGHSGPYVQYCHVRCTSVLEKAEISPDEREVFQKLPKMDWEDIEMELIETLLCFETQVSQALYKFKPHILATYLLELCRVFNRFYTECQILNSNKKEARLFLVKATKKVLKNGLRLLNIKVPSAM